MPPRPQIGAKLRRSIAATAALLLAILTIGATATPAAADAETVRKSVVHLHMEWSAQVSISYDDGTTKSATATSAGGCTGFFASAAGDISTAGHCVDDADAVKDVKLAFIEDLVAEGAVIKDDATFDAYYEAIQLLTDPTRRVLAYQPQGMAGAVLSSPIEVQVVDFKPLDEGDHALLRLNGFETPTPAASFAMADPGSGTDVAAMGFPGVVADMTDAYRKPASVFYGKVSGFAPRGGVPFTEIGIAMSGGMSGGPVFDATTDQVYGNVSFGPHKDTGETNDINFATDTTDMVAFLKGHGVPVETGAPADDDKPAAQGPAQAPEPADSSAIGVIGLVIGLIVLGGIAVLVVFLVRRKRKPQPAAGSNFPGQSAQQTNRQQGWPQQGPPQPPHGQHPNGNWQQPPQGQQGNWQQQPHGQQPPGNWQQQQQPHQGNPAPWGAGGQQQPWHGQQGPGQQVPPAGTPAEPRQP
jgi:hypothetical protein